MSNKANHRRLHGHIRRKNPHPCGRAVCGVCGPKSMLAKREIAYRIDKREASQELERISRPGGKEQR